MKQVNPSDEEIVNASGACQTASIYFSMSNYTRRKLMVDTPHSDNVKLQVPLFSCLLVTSLRKAKPMRWWMAECLIWLLLLPLFPLWAKKNSDKATHLLWAAQWFNSYVLRSAFSWFIIKSHKTVVTFLFVRLAGSERMQAWFALDP